MALRLRQPGDSAGDLVDDLKQIAIDRIGQDQYDKLDPTSINKIDEYTYEQAVAIQAFLQRQELNITDMEAYGVIEKDQILVDGGVVAGGAVAGPGSPVVGASIKGPATNRNRIKFRVQISDTKNSMNIKEVKDQVKRTLVKFVRIFF
jgi:hypothetical protein